MDEKSCVVFHSVFDRCKSELVLRLRRRSQPRTLRFRDTISYGKIKLNVPPVLYLIAALDLEWEIEIICSIRCPLDTHKDAHSDSRSEAVPRQSLVLRYGVGTSGGRGQASTANTLCEGAGWA